MTDQLIKEIIKMVKDMDLENITQLWINKLIKEIIKMVQGMDMENITHHIVLMKVIGNMMNIMAKEIIVFLDKNIKAIGRMAKQTVKGNCVRGMAKHIKETGRMINGMEMENCAIPMEQHIKETGRMINGMDMENILMLVDLAIREIGRMMNIKRKNAIFIDG